MKPALIIMAAGMGSRYGGLKQLDGVGPGGEIIMDYSVFDALRAGFGKIVFVLRRDMEHDFYHNFISRYKGKITFEIVLQELDKIPAGYSFHPDREKPWGTNHAIMMGATVIREPFAVINADDYYGVDTFRVMGAYLQTLGNSKNKYAMVGFRLENTLSDKGGVARGICVKDEYDNLTSIVERTYIVRENGVIKYREDNGTMTPIAPNTPVSMNIWGFTPDYFTHSETLFKVFLQEKGQELKSEFFIPSAVNQLIEQNLVTVKVLSTTSQWFGVTYRDDRPTVTTALRTLHEKGVYPPKLF